MNASPAAAAIEVFSWSWGHPKLGMLTTVVQSDGVIRQQRRHPRDAAHSDNAWGRISPEQARQLIQQVVAVLGDVATPDGAVPPFPPTNEFVEARVHSSGGVVVRRVAVAELGRDKDMAALRAAVVRLRKQVSGGFFSWRSIGGRLAFLLTAVIGMMTWWIVRDWRETAAMEQSAERLSATVLDRTGKNGFDSSKSITVRLTPQSGERMDQKIEQYLSAENWEQSQPGTTVRVWRDATSGHTYLENDIQRWNRDKKWIPLLPIGIALPILVTCFCLSQYRVGVHDDGREYLVKEDCVTGDDRDSSVDRTTYNTGRLLWWLVK